MIKLITIRNDNTVRSFSVRNALGFEIGQIDYYRPSLSAGYGHNIYNPGGCVASVYDCLGRELIVETATVRDALAELGAR